VRDDEFGTEALVAFAKEFSQYMMDAGGLGLAATQVLEAPGGEPWSLVALRVDSERFGIFCNPTIVQRIGHVSAIEGCLSFASVGVTVSAPEMVEMAFRNARGAPGSILLDGVRARYAAHEVDHLAGRTLVDRMTPMKQAAFLRDVKRVRERMVS
jgi:peptide deformylase